MVLINLFLTFLKIRLFAVGGAYSFLPLLEREVVERYHWLSRGEFLDVLGVARIFPGAISIKYATYVGYKIGGVWGATVANLGNLLPPAILISVAFGLYSKYRNLPGVERAFSLIQLAVFAMIIAVAFRLIKIEQLIQAKSLLTVLLCFTLFIYTRIHPALIVIGAGLIGALLK